jgi:hypothetical protein
MDNRCSYWRSLRKSGTGPVPGCPLRRATPVAATSVTPALTRSASFSAPHTPYSPFCLANSRHGPHTSQSAHRAKALRSLLTRASGRSNGSEKKRVDWPMQLLCARQSVLRSRWISHNSAGNRLIWRIFESLIHTDTQQSKIQTTQLSKIQTKPRRLSQAERLRLV